MVADYFQILVLRQWRSATKSLAVVVKNCNCTKEMSSLKPVSKTNKKKLQLCLKKGREKPTDPSQGEENPATGEGREERGQGRLGSY